MSSDHSFIESELRRLRPAALDAALLDRLEACATQTWDKPSPAEIRFESTLAAAAPAALPPDFMASLEATVSRVPFPAERTIVLFPKKAEAPPRSKPVWLGAAALVALCGVLSALLVPIAEKSDRVVAHPQTPPTATDNGAANHLAPAGFERGFSEASDEGVIWRSADQAHRVLKVVYKDSVTLRDAEGRIYQMEEPRIEYILVPAKID